MIPGKTIEAVSEPLGPRQPVSFGKACHDLKQKFNAAMQKAAEADQDVKFNLILVSDRPPWERFLLKCPMSVLYQQEGEIIVASCLDYDIVTQGDTVDEARSHLAEALEMMRDEGQGMGVPSPKELWDKFHGGRPIEYPGGLDAFAKGVVERLAS